MSSQLPKTDRLRSQISSVNECFVGFNDTIALDARKRREQEDAKFQDVHSFVARLDKALNTEVKRRMEANRQLQDATENLANDMLDKLQKKIVHRIERLTGALDSLVTRSEALETSIAQIRGEAPYNKEGELAEIVREIAELKLAIDNDKRKNMDNDNLISKRVGIVEYTSESKFEAEVTTRQEQFDFIRKELERLSRAEESSAEEFRSFLMEEIHALKNGLSLSTLSRERSDDEIVQAINQYTSALQKGLQTASLR
eukprot:GHVT01082751.1.p1 GENE.GHVT01082751.1~~GHVT01082751.1.p1  ORF type:complete len:257 (+),score=19.72 GHVT01082751.1:847-1617(+)